MRPTLVYRNAALYGAVLLLTACGGSGGVDSEPVSAARLSSRLAAPAVVDEYDQLRTKWLTQITGGAGINTADPDIAAQIALLTSTAQADWNSLNTATGRTALWSDLTDWSASSTITASYGRLRDMAVAYATTGSSLKGNASLAAAIISGLDWMNANHYGSSVAAFGNWWDFQIGSPQALNDLMVLMYDQLGSAQLAAYTGAIDKYVPDPTIRTGSSIVETGANRLDKAAVAALRGVVGKSNAKLAQGRDAISQTFPYVTGGDGFYVDGSFIQHTNIAYTGSYGLVMLGDVARLFYLLNGSSWAVTDAGAGNVYTWATQAYRPFVYQGAMMDSVRGRAISRALSSDHDAGRSLTATLARLAQGLPAAQAASLKSTVKHWMQRDTSYASYYTGLSLYDIVNLKAVLADSTVTPDPEQIQTHVFASMDRVLHTHAGYAFNLSMFSNRISAFEYGNGENLTGWFTGVGGTWLYNGDLAQFDGGYWPTVNMRRLPGITTDGSGSGTPVSFGAYPNTQTWVGGSEIDNLHASAGMQFSLSGVTGTTLTGKKSWFMFGDKIIALGSGIANTDGRSVETIVENRKLNAAGSNALTINGTTMPATMGWSATTAGVQWAHLAGSVSGSDIGYYFPAPVSLGGLRETRSASWQAINTGQSATPVSNRFLSLALSHGAGPANATYAYVVLPNLTAAQTASYAAAPTVTVLENSADAHAVKDSNGGVVGINFWNDVSKTVSDGAGAYITSNRKASVTVIEAGGELHLGVSDPTQKNTGTINLELQRAAWQVISADAGVTVTQLSPTIKLTVNVNAAAGKSFAVKLALAQNRTLVPVADAYVINGASAGVNYGTANVLVTKNDGVGYYRQAYLRFDLSTLSGSVSNARLVMTPTSLGGYAGLVNQVQLVPTDSWNETTLTWNNQPAATTLLGSWTLGAAYAPVYLDLTAQINSALAGDKLVSLLVSSPTNVGADGWVNYGSRETTNAAYRPALVVTTH